jgi:maltooligosyltrehalose synthase
MKEFRRNLGIEKKIEKQEKDPENGRLHIKWYERMQKIALGQTPEIKKALEKVMEEINQLEKEDKEQTLDRLEEIFKEKETKNQGSLEEIIGQLNKEFDLEKQKREKESL